jgi:hypothetical protein
MAQVVECLSSKYGPEFKSQYYIYIPNLPNTDIISRIRKISILIYLFLPLNGEMLYSFMLGKESTIWYPETKAFNYGTIHWINAMGCSPSVLELLVSIDVS